MFFRVNFLAFLCLKSIILCIFADQMEIVLIRHTSVAVPKAVCYGQTDVDVAATFEEEAARTKAELSAYEPFDAVYSSPLKRARLLAAYCGYEHPVVDARLMEMSMGDWEMRPYAEFVDDYSREWFENYLTMPTPGGESFQMLYKRVAAFLDELRQRDYQRVAIFAHGGVLACAGVYGGLYDVEHIWDHPVEYGGILRVES